MVTWDELKRWKPEGLDSFIDLLVNSRKKAVGGGDHKRPWISPQGGKARGCGGSAEARSLRPKNPPAAEKHR